MSDGQKENCGVFPKEYYNITMSLHKDGLFNIVCVQISLLLIIYFIVSLLFAVLVIIPIAYILYSVFDDALQKVVSKQMLKVTGQKGRA